LAKKLIIQHNEDEIRKNMLKMTYIHKDSLRTALIRRVDFEDSIAIITDEDGQELGMAAINIRSIEPHSNDGLGVSL